MSDEELQLIGSQVRKAGENIRNCRACESDYNTISLWRSVHIPVMSSMVSSIRSKLRNNKMSAVVLARRLKRLQSIELKLQRFGGMRLDRMQDIAGVRVVFRDLAEVMYFDFLMRKSPPKNFKLDRVKNYIEKPKDDGYRSIHQIFQFESSPKIFLELQIRTQLQHFWATAVEVLGMKTGSKIKQGGGESYHRLFFGLCGALFCLKESSPLLSAYKDLSKEQICAQIRELADKYKIFKHLSALAISSKAIIQSNTKNKYYFVIRLDMVLNTLQINGYRKSDFEKAERDYRELELQSLVDGKTDAVLISLDKIKQLKSAYPNYYLDCSAFIGEVKKELQNT